MTDYRDRMKVELEQLQERILKLFDFLGGAVYATLDPVDQKLLTSQYHIMVAYEAVLKLRLDRATSHD